MYGEDQYCCFCINIDNILLECRSCIPYLVHCYTGIRRSVGELFEFSVASV